MLIRGYRSFPAVILSALLLVPAALPAIGLEDERELDPRIPQDLEQFQGYLDEAPEGMGVWHAWTFPGGRGENVRIIDIEPNWNLKHRELAPGASDLVISIRGDDPHSEFTVDHGTAVLGILVGADDGVGITGIANSARFGVISPLGLQEASPVAEAIRRATNRLEPGDVILLEHQSAAGPRFNPLTGMGLVPSEFEPEIFEAIKAATAKGVVVVAPAGNGSENLDAPVYNGAFNRGTRDSGAILVGAGWPPPGLYGPGPDLVATEESNYGSRVDLQGWGRFVTTSGYGDLRRDQGQDNWYTINFGATSAAAAMVAGVAAVLQSIVIEQGRPPLTPIQLRRLLTTTGTRQPELIERSIGPRPDLRAAIAALDADETGIPVITRVRFKSANGKLIVDGANFVPGSSVIEIDGVVPNKIKYPMAYILPSGATTRVFSKKTPSSMIPKGVEITITIFNPETGTRSDPFTFVR